MKWKHRMVRHGEPRVPAAAWNNPAHRGPAAGTRGRKEFEEALRTRKYRETHRRALRHAYEEAGVTGVPMFVIGDQVLTGLQDREALEAVIEEELARQTARR
jgi:protein-disulfide isomerase